MFDELFVYPSLADHIADAAWREKALSTLQRLAAIQPYTAENLYLYFLPAALAYDHPFAVQLLGIMRESLNDLPDKVRKTLDKIYGGAAIPFSQLRASSGHPLYDQNRLLTTLRGLEQDAKKKALKGKGKSAAPPIDPFRKERRALLSYLDGQLSLAQEDHKEALKAYTDAFKAMEVLPDRLAQLLTTGLGKISGYLRDDGGDDLRKVLEMAAATNPNDDLILAELGRAYIGAGMMEAAQEALDRSLAIQPNAPAFALIGMIHYMNDDWEAARQAQLQALELDPTYVESYRRLGAVYYHLHQADAAVESLEKAADYAGDDPEVLSHLAMMCHDTGRFAQAAETYQRCVALEPAYIHEYYDYIGDAYTALGEFDKAIEAYGLALKANPQYVASYNGLGTVHRLRADWDRAETAFRHVIRLVSDHPAAYAGLAVVHRARGEMALYEESMKLSRRYIAEDAPYDLACWEAIAGHVEESLALLAKVDDLKWMKRAQWHPDFAAMRDNPQFRQWAGLPE